VSGFNAGNIEETKSEREERLMRSRRRGGENGSRRGYKVLDSYLPVRPYSPERAKPWEM